MGLPLSYTDCAVGRGMGRVREAGPHGDRVSNISCHCPECLVSIIFKVHYSGGLLGVSHAACLGIFVIYLFFFNFAVLFIFVFKETEAAEKSENIDSFLF
jgi:hypothetical protein